MENPIQLAIVSVAFLIAPSTIEQEKNEKFPHKIYHSYTYMSRAKLLTQMEVCVRNVFSLSQAANVFIYCVAISRSVL